MTYVNTPKDSRFGGLILPQDTLAQMIRYEIGAASSYSSASRSNKNVAEWDTSLGSADADTLPYIDTLRAQARDLDRNNPLASGSLDTIVDNVVGTGLRPQASIDGELLGLTEEQTSRWQRAAERFFYMWADSPNADVTRYATFWEYQGLALLNSLLSGDVFTVRRFKLRPDSVFGVCLQMIEGDRCATPPDKSGVESNVHKGVEVDADGQPVRYHFLKQHPGDIGLRRVQDLGKYTAVDAVDRNGLDLCLHHFQRRRPDQRRGVSVLAPVIEYFKQISRYTEAEITAAVVSGMFSVMIKTEIPSGIGGISGTIPGMVGGQQITPKGTGLTRLQSGMIMDLAPGESVDVVNPARPNTAFEPFIDAVFKYIGVGLGLPKEVMLKEFTTSYTAARAAVMEAYKMYRRRRQWLVKTLCQPVYNMVITEAIARGYLDAPGFFDSPVRRAAWLGALWRGAPMGQLDPLKEAKAAKEWLGYPGLTTAQQITSEYFGTDYEDNLAQTARERKQIADLPPDPLAPVAPKGPDMAPDNNDGGQ